MNVVKNGRYSVRYFEQLSVQSSVQNSVCRAMIAVAEIIAKGGSRVLLGLLTTGKPVSYVAMAAVR